MASVNKVILLGNLGQDPQVRYTPDGTAIVRLSVATSRSWLHPTTKEKQTETEWHNVMLYQRQAEIAGEYLKKGSTAYFEGRLRTRKWTDKNNIERYTTEIIADTIQLLGSRNDTQNTSAQTASTQAVAAPTTAPQATQAPVQRTPVPAAVQDLPDDLPPF